MESQLSNFSLLGSAPWILRGPFLLQGYKMCILCLAADSTWVVSKCEAEVQLSLFLI